jgi:hypothetical protein
MGYSDQERLDLLQNSFLVPTFISRVFDGKALPSVNFVCEEAATRSMIPMTAKTKDSSLEPLAKQTSPQLKRRPLPMGRPPARLKIG